MNKGKVLLNKYKKQALFACVLMLALATLSFKDDLFQIAKNLDVFASVYKEVNINYVDDINSSKMLKTGVDAMLDDLDPYTEFVPESEIEDYRLHYVSTQYGGIGAGIFGHGVYEMLHRRDRIRILAFLQHMHVTAAAG